MKKILRSILSFLPVLFCSKASGQWDYVKFQTENVNDYINYATYSFDGTQIWATSALTFCDTAVYLSTDGGYNFKPIHFKSKPDCKSIVYMQSLNDRTVYLLGRENGTFMYYTTDLGKTWKQKIINHNGDTAFKNSEIEGFIFYDSLRGSAWGKSSLDTGLVCKEIWNTGDGGKTWSRLSCDSIKIPKNESIDHNPKAVFGSTYYNSTSPYHLDRYLTVSYNYGHYWYHRNPDNLNSQSGRVVRPSFRDSLTGIGRYEARDPRNVNAFYGITHDGGRTWDSIPVPYKAFEPHYVPPGEPGDSGFYLLNGASDGAFLSYDDLKTTVKFSHYNHFNFFYKDTKHLISSVSQILYGHDLLIFKHFGYTGKKETEENIEAKAYPNPFQNTLTVRSEIPARIKLLDLKGLEVLEKQISEGETLINTSELPPGFFILICETGDKIQTTKLVKTD